MRLAKVYERGGLNHGDRNWERGLPLSRLIDSSIRHLIQYKMSKYMPELNDEDHLSHSAWNVLAIIHTEEMIKRGHLSKELDDLPCYEPYKVNDNEVLKLERDLHPLKIEIHTDGTTVKVSHDPSGHSVTRFQSPDQRHNYFNALKELKEIIEYTGETTERLERKKEINKKIKEAEDEGLYEISEHLTSNIDLDFDDDVEPRCSS
jgi:hypothetical protein